jgi:hypothetical protein
MVGSLNKKNKSYTAGLVAFFMRANKIEGISCFYSVSTNLVFETVLLKIILEPTAQNGNKMKNGYNEHQVRPFVLKLIEKYGLPSIKNLYPFEKRVKSFFSPLRYNEQIYKLTISEVTVDCLVIDGYKTESDHKYFVVPIFHQ